LKIDNLFSHLSSKEQKVKRLKKYSKTDYYNFTKTDYSQNLREAFFRRDANSKTVHLASMLAKPILSISTTQVLQKPTSFKVISQRPIITFSKTVLQPRTNLLPICRGKLGQELISGVWR